MPPITSMTATTHTFSNIESMASLKRNPMTAAGKKATNNLPVKIEFIKKVVFHTSSIWRTPVIPFTASASNTLHGLSRKNDSNTGKLLKGLHQIV